MLHLVYIIAFTILAFLAVSNLIRNLMILGADSRRGYGSGPNKTSRSNTPAHPELLDESGQVVREPYLVMRSISVEDARERLDEIYKLSPGVSDNSRDESVD